MKGTRGLLVQVLLRPGIEGVGGGVGLLVAGTLDVAVRGFLCIITMFSEYINFPS